MKHSQYVEIVESTFASLLKQALLKAVLTKLPFLATGPLNMLAVKLITILAEAVAKQTEMRAFFKFVDFGTDGQAVGFEAAMINNHNAQISGTIDEKNKAESSLSDSLGKLWNLKR